MLKMELEVLDTVQGSFITHAPLYQKQSGFPKSEANGSQRTTLEHQPDRMLPLLLVCNRRRCRQFGSIVNVGILKSVIDTVDAVCNF